jgi:hypothetical protein
VAVQALLQEYLSRRESPIHNPASDPFPIPGYILPWEQKAPSTGPPNGLEVSTFPPACPGKLQWVDDVQPPQPGTAVLLPLRALLPHVLMSLYGDPDILAGGGFGVPEWVSRSAEFVTEHEDRMACLVCSLTPTASPETTTHFKFRLLWCQSTIKPSHNPAMSAVQRADEE